MNKKAKLSIALLSILVSSIMIADLSKGILISDQLEVLNGSYVEGKVLHSDGGSVVDDLFSYATIKVDDIFTTTDTSEKLIQVTVSQEIQPDYYSNYFNYINNESKVEMTHLVFYDNRTTFLAFARIFVDNGTESIEVSLLGATKISELMDFNRTKITYANGSSYVLSTMTPAQEASLSFILADFDYWINFFKIEYAWTIFGISPIANVGDTVNFAVALGDVVGKPPVTTSLGESMDTIHVKYTHMSIFGWWDAPEINAYYDIETGFLIKLVEEGVVKFEFVPASVKLGSGIPFSTIGIVLGLAVIGLITYFVRKKK